MWLGGHLAEKWRSDSDPNLGLPACVIAGGMMIKIPYLKRVIILEWNRDGTATLSLPCDTEMIGCSC